MSDQFITYAFVSGEISRTLFARTDLDKYDLGLALARNVFIDYRGGVSNRPGTKFIDIIQFPRTPTRWFKFVFSPDVANTYGVLFGQGCIRFVQDGAYVLEDPVTITDIPKALQTRVTAPAHGYDNGDLVKLSGIVGMTQLNNRSFVILVDGVNAFFLNDIHGDYIDSTGYDAYVSGGTVSKVYTIGSPYALDDLATVKAHQNRDVLRFTHPDYAIYDLVRNDHTDWEFAPSVIGSTHPAPTSVNGSPSAAGTSAMLWGVTAVSHENEESHLSETFLEQASVAYNTTAGYYFLVWNPAVDTKYYNVYRSNIMPNASEANKGAQLGFLGRTSSTTFTDTNIIPNFTITAPTGQNPFAAGAVRIVNITNGGAGYTNASVLTMTDPTGTGFSGYPVVAGGKIVAIIVTSAGTGYTAPSLSASIGAGAVFTYVVTPLTGNNPACGVRFQQRTVYASSRNQPVTVWGSRPGKYSNFDFSPVVIDSDSYEFDLDTEDLAPIRHLFAMRGGLLCMTQTGVYQLSGGNGIAISPSNALSEPQSYTGVSSLTPLKVETDLLYVEGKGYTVRMLSYTELSKVYSGTDISILSNHFFSKTKQITAWAFAQDPFNLVWGIRSDGAMLSFTTVKEQNVFAWTLNTTRGFYKDVISLQENQVDTVYLTVERIVGDKITPMIEQISPRTFAKAEDAFFVDSGLSLPIFYPAGTLLVGAATGENVFCISDSDVFTAGDVGKIIRIAGGKAEITEYLTLRTVRVLILDDLTEFLPESETVYERIAGEWSMDLPVTTITGFWHLEGQRVNVLMDGAVELDLLVTQGQITLPRPATRVSGGLGYRSLIQTLPTTTTAAVIDGRRRRPVGVSVSMFESRGMSIGTRLDNLYDMKERTTENYGQPPSLQTRSSYQMVEAEWDENGQIYLVQDLPLPATVLGLVHDLEIGDDAA